MGAIHNNLDDQIKSIRHNVFFGPGYHVIRGYLSRDQATGIRNFWLSHRSPPRKGVLLYEKCPDVSELSPDRDVHHGYFWNQPIDPASYAAAWQMQALRNDIEGNDPGVDYVPTLHSMLADSVSTITSTYQVTNTRNGGVVEPHSDWTRDLHRVQLTLVLSDYGTDYSGGFFLHDQLIGGNKQNICEKENLRSGDLLIFRYFRTHGVDFVTSSEGRPGFCRLRVALRTMPVSAPGYFDRAFRQLPEAVTTPIRNIRKRMIGPKSLFLGADNVVEKYPDMSAHVEHLAREAIESGVSPRQLFEQDGLINHWVSSTDP